MNPQHDLIRRMTATQATLDRFRGKGFDWRGQDHCSELLRFHLRQMGHVLPTWPRVKSMIAAKRALRERGCETMLDLCGQWLKLPEVPPAAMLMGDLAVAGSKDGIGGVLICAGPQKVFGWREDAPELVVLDVNFGEFDGAFRV